ncbi:ribosome maturation factor RimP [Lederbergia sp. NSJ-179]|uniref:ribosome maturation factor RimP n=1 Tax=Lederbergia sp. NSJ-179 TaxID=2931402 RepID=UPI001FD56DD2|nr:ribosome maturation factor RimP [Lederbergia sp. NSJ-179]MCJ7839676.1 ribosome maturation factor RimP [Lederbergia sp. NSJ-179]
MSKVTDLVEELARPILDEMGLELVDTEYVKEGKNWFLRLFIDKESGIDIEECGLVSERLSTQLDEIDPIPHNYFLEVSSPGAERPLKKEKDFIKAVGKKVHINTYEPIDGEKSIEGRLIAFDHQILTMEVKVKTQIKTIEVPLAKISKARMAVEF